MTLEKYIVVDLETTGLDPKKDKIIEIGALKIQDNQVVDQFSSLVNPGRKLEERIVEITGICDAELEGAEEIENVLPKFLEFAQDWDLMGHSVLFDFSFLKKACVNAGYAFERKGIDTLRIARRHLPELESRSLPYLCQHFAIPHNPHRAFSDVEATYALYQKLCQLFYKESLSAEEKMIFQPRQLIYQVKKEQPASKRQIALLQKLLDYHKIEPKQNINKMTRNEISRYTDQVILAFGRHPKAGG